MEMTASFMLWSFIVGEDMKKQVKYLILSLLLPFIVSSAQNLTGKNGKVLHKSQNVDEKQLNLKMIDCTFRNDGYIARGNPGGFYFPAGQPYLTTVYTSGLWVLGKVNGEIRSAHCTFGTEFQPGMILPDGTPDSTDAGRYIVYKYRKGDVIDAEALYQGCPEEVLGDQMLFCVYNDVRSHQGVWGSAPLSVEVKQTSYGFDRDGPLGHAVFIHFNITNKGSQAIDSAYMAMSLDTDLGFCNDDYSGCDTNLQIAFVYNGFEKDYKYGNQVPAMACDLLQGAIVESPGDSVILPNGIILQDHKHLGMTAYFTYMDGSQFAGLKDPHKPETGYFLASGFQGTGEPWLDPKLGNQPTPFPFSGDPVTGKGWLYSDLTEPEDIRMGVSSGPFNLNVGEAQDFMVALVVGQGTDRYSSIQVMREYDHIVQEAFESNYVVGGPPPRPAVAVAELDREIVLIWDNQAELYSLAGYAFEGYNIWQGESQEGPWTRIKTYDVKNNVLNILDRYYDYSINGFVEKVVQHGTDSGIFHYLHFIKDYLINEPLINGKTYYYAVSAYSHNNAGVPKVYESEKVLILAVPHRPVLDTAYQSEVGDKIVTQKFGPLTDASVAVNVVDPSNITGYAYKVSFDTTENGEWYWSLLNNTNGEIMLDHQHQLYGANYGPIIDGFQINVQAPDPVYHYGINLNEGLNRVLDSNYHGWWSWGYRNLTGVDWGGVTFWSGLDIGERFLGSILSPYDYYDVRIKFFTEGQHLSDPVRYPSSECAVYNLNRDTLYQGIGTFFGVAYDWEDPDSPRRLNICFMEKDSADLRWDPFAADLGDSLGGHEILFIMSSDYNGGAGYDDNNRGFESDVLYVLWLKPRYGYSQNNYFLLDIYAIHPTSLENTFSFDTKGFEPKKSDETAGSRLKDINVFPNPYFGYNKAERTLYEHFVTFNNLPERDCTIRVFSLSGQLVRVIEHNNGTPFERWDLENDHGLPIGSGMYIIHVRTNWGDRILKFGFINREAVYQY